MAPHDQHGADVRFDWGSQGLASLLAGGVRTVVIVDVLRFTTAVDVACGRGAAVTPFPWGDEAVAAEEADRRSATLASRGAAGGDVSVPSLSPVSLRNLTAADHILLPSPNGATLACLAAEAGAVVLAGCLRNAAAVAEAVNAFPAGIVAAGERWPDGGMRVAVEDAWGAGALVRELSPPAASDPAAGLFAMFGEALGGAQPATTGRTRSLSPEAAWAAANLPNDLPSILPKTASGRELHEAGWSLDIEVAAALNVSRTVPRLDAEGTFRA
jgi:2-phosphosulfolactate phosphatase